MFAEEGSMAYVINDQGNTLTLEEFFETLVNYGLIFAGEKHDSRLAHEAELALLKELFRRDSHLVLALEMFERDVQDVVDAYLRGEIPEDSFLQSARPWPNYEEDYRPLVEFAKEKGIPVVAANVPRKAAALVSRENEISANVLGPDSVYLPDTIHFDSREYCDRFMATLEGMPRGGMMGRLDPEALYKAQILKDAVMAASLEPFLDRTILFCCGHFHSDDHLGIPYQLQKNHPEIKIAVIAFASSVVELNGKDTSRLADFIWIGEG
jgi:uncharacterized iron-regulated protein